MPKSIPTESKPAHSPKKTPLRVEGGRIWVNATIPGAEGEYKEEPIEVQQFEADPAYVEVSAGLTQSLPDYGSLKIMVAVRLPCYKEEIEEAAAYAGEVAEKRLTAEMSLYLDTIMQSKTKG